MFPLKRLSLTVTARTYYTLFENLLLENLPSEKLNLEEIILLCSAQDTLREMGVTFEVRRQTHKQGRFEKMLDVDGKWEDS